MKLYRLETGLINGDYWVLAKDPTEAENKLIAYLKDYGFADKRKVTAIIPVAEATDDLRYITNKNLVL